LTYTLAPTLSLSDFQTVSELYIRSSTFNVGTSNSDPIPDRFQPPPPPIIVNDERNSKSPKSSTPRLTTDVMPASYCILSDGQVMRALTKKLPGSSLPNSDMLPNSLRISTLPIQPSLVLCQVFDLGTFYFNLKSIEVFKLYKFKHFYLTILLPYSRILNFFFTNRHPSLYLNLGNPFQAHSAPSEVLGSPQGKRDLLLPTRVVFPPSPLHSDSTSDSTSTGFFFRHRDPQSPTYPALLV